MCIRDSISTPRSSTTTAGNNNTVLHGDSGQVWCTIPRDVFNIYSVDSKREASTITMEYNCESLLSVFKRYDRVMNQGSSSDMTIKLRSLSELEMRKSSEKVNNNNDKKSNMRPNPICVLAIFFEEVIQLRNDAHGGGPDSRSNIGGGGNKVIMHSFKVPVKLLYGSQDQKIQEPLINYSQLMMCRLPAMSGENGGSFHNFMKRIDRYSNVTHMKLSGRRERARDSLGDVEENVRLNIIVDELLWNLQISWNGPLNPVIQQQQDEQMLSSQDGPAGMNDSQRSSNACLLYTSRCV